MLIIPINHAMTSVCDRVTSSVYDCIYVILRTLLRTQIQEMSLSFCNLSLRQTQHMILSEHVGMCF